MKLHCIAFAAAAAAALIGSAAHAAPYGEVPNPAKFTITESATGVVSATYTKADNSVVTVDQVLLLAGASASAKTIGTFVLNDNCDSTNVSVIWDGSAGSNFRAYACDFAAANVINSNASGSLLVIKRDAGGSALGVLPIANPTKIDFLTLGANTRCVAIPNKTKGTLNDPNYNCPGVVAGSYNLTTLTLTNAPVGTTPYYPDAGVSDVEPTIIAASANGGPGGVTTVGSLTTTPIFQQVIGVAVNTKLYRALQKSQGLPQDDYPGNRPTLASEFITSAIGGKLRAGGTQKGWGLAVDAQWDSAVHNKQINVCRRTNGSGTQAAANLQFNNVPCGGLPVFSSSTVAAIIGSGTSAPTTNGSTGAVETCLGNINALTNSSPVTPTDFSGAAYAIGHVGRDNDPFAGGVDKGYRFVKVDGWQPEAHPNPATGACDGAYDANDPIAVRTTRNFPGCTDAQSGKYKYVYESTMQYNGTNPPNVTNAKLAVLNTIATVGFGPAQLTGNDASVIAGVMSLPNAATTWAQLTNPIDPERIYGGRTTRGGNSCIPLYQIK